MQIFQRNILNKYIKGLDNTLIDERYKTFSSFFLDPERQANILNSKEEQFQEGFLRELFVKILGYTLNPDPNFNLTTEKKNETNSKKADGAILVDGKVVGVIELKDHKTPDLSKVEAQAFNYKSQHKEAVYVVISNFEKLRFYIDNAVDFEEFDLFHLTRDDFARLWICLAYENIEKNLPKHIKAASLTNEDQITNALYKDYSNFKRDLFEDILKNNPTDDTAHKILLFKKTQKLLDRILFIFFAEDRGLLPPNSIMLIINQWEKLKELDEYQPFYNRLKKYFGYMNTGFQVKNYEIFAYNGGLFKPDEILDGLTISDEVLMRYCKKISDYDFQSDVDVNILGHIFENSLTEIEEVTERLLTSGHDPMGQPQTASKRKKDGVFYTPQYITKYIVDNTVGKLCREKKAELGIDESEYFTDKKRQFATKKALIEKLDAYRDWLLQISICDPACGSGAFLNAALNFLIDEHKLIDEMQAKVEGAAIVFPNVENSILENNLYGVDINEESVEIAKLSLWLRTAKPHRKLSSLNNNIKCGNSLIDDPAIAGDKAFCWEKEFPKIFHEKQKRPWHITTAVHDSRTSDRMIEYDVRRLRDHGTRPYPEPMLLSTEEEIIITETVAKIVEEDKLNVLAYNICFDHMHLLLVCEEEEVPKIVGKIKSMTARAVNIAMGRTIPTTVATKKGPAGTTAIATESPVGTTAVATAGHDPLTLPDATLPANKLPKKGVTQCSLWGRKFGNTYINSDEHLYNAIEYIRTNREHHGLDPLPVEYPHCVSIEEAFRPEYTGGFDVVIGNPPYLRVQGLRENFEKESKFYEQHYASATERFDFYVLFMERAFFLLNHKGLMTFILPHKFINAGFGIGIRKFIYGNKALKSLIHFGAEQVFEDASVYTCIIGLSKCQNHEFEFAKVAPKELSNSIETENIPEDRLSDSNSWNISSGNDAGILDKLNKMPFKVKDVFKGIFQGIVSGDNKAFYLYDCIEKENYIEGFSLVSNSRILIERDICKPIFTGKTISRYNLIDKKEFLIYPYHLQSEKTVFYNETELEKNFPKCFEYFQSIKERLENRGTASMSYPIWYALWNARSIQNLSARKIFTPDICFGSSMCFDNVGRLHNDTSYGLILKEPCDRIYKAYLAIFNSKITWYFLTKTGTELRGGYYRFKTKYLEPFPLPDLSSLENKDYADSLSVLADQILTSNEQLQQKRQRFLHRLQENLGVQKITTTLERFDEADFKTVLAELKKQKISLSLTQQDEWEDYFTQYKADCNALTTQIAATDKEIDRMVYELYGLTPDEIKVVEGE